MSGGTQAHYPHEGRKKRETDALERVRKRVRFALHLRTEGAFCAQKAHSLFIKALAMSDKFYCTKETLKATLAQYGVAIIPRVLDPAEITAMQSGAWAAVEHMGKHLSVPITQANPVSWRSYGELYPMHNMLVQHWEVGHAQFIWDIRQNPKVVDTFATLWACKPTDLLTSMDAMSFHFPPETTNKGYFRQAWYHTGQSYHHRTVLFCTFVVLTPLFAMHSVYAQHRPDPSGQLAQVHPVVGHGI